MKKPWQEQLQEQLEKLWARYPTKRPEPPTIRRKKLASNKAEDNIDLAYLIVRTSKGTINPLPTFYNLRETLENAAYYRRTGVDAMNEPRTIITWNNIATVCNIHRDRADWTNTDKAKMLKWAGEHLESFSSRPAFVAAAPKIDADTAEAFRKDLPALFKLVGNEVNVAVLTGMYLAGDKAPIAAASELQHALSVYFRLNGEDYSMGGGPAPVVRRLKVGGKATGLDKFPPRKPRGKNKSNGSE